jgi:1,2-phenylacetyl-CoA epoxidase PaaB subunit
MALDIGRRNFCALLAGSLAAGAAAANLRTRPPRRCPACSAWAVGDQLITALTEHEQEQRPEPTGSTRRSVAADDRSAHETAGPT